MSVGSYGTPGCSACLSRTLELPTVDLIMGLMSLGAARHSGEKLLSSCWAWEQPAPKTPSLHGTGRSLPAWHPAHSCLTLWVFLPVSLANSSSVLQALGVSLLPGPPASLWPFVCLVGASPHPQDHLGLRQPPVSFAGRACKLVFPGKLETAGESEPRSLWAGPWFCTGACKGAACGC